MGHVKAPGEPGYGQRCWDDPMMARRRAPHRGVGRGPPVLWSRPSSACCRNPRALGISCRAELVKPCRLTCLLDRFVRRYDSRRADGRPRGLRNLGPGGWVGQEPRPPTGWPALAAGRAVQ
ncbi:hypothetical protein CDD83_5343 [Cordyceps sp. RAO-2017]|nr:hypothetical protein CDD83_5343 [Cordyceps sp. RAO-2017]